MFLLPYLFLDPFIPVRSFGFHLALWFAPLFDLVAWLFHDMFLLSPVYFSLVFALLFQVLVPLPDHHSLIAPAGLADVVS